MIIIESQQKPCITSTIINEIQQKSNRTKLNAFIITQDCNSLRFNASKKNIERVFPNFFNIICFLTIPLNDSRIHTSPILHIKKFSSNLLTFVEIWTYEIPKYSKDNELEWSFIFEDDVDFWDPAGISLTNYIEPLKELIYNPEVQNKDGFVYLGICGPTYPNNSQPFISKNTSILTSHKSYGFCLHASGITAKRSRLFWSEISSYRPSGYDTSLDHQVREYCIRSKSYFYTLGTNFESDPAERHCGITYQDRTRFKSTIV
jgi:hypothetical protein